MVSGGLAAPQNQSWKWAVKQSHCSLLFSQAQLPSACAFANGKPWARNHKVAWLSWTLYDHRVESYSGNDTSVEFIQLPALKTILSSLFQMTEPEMVISKFPVLNQDNNMDFCYFMHKG